MDEKLAECLTLVRAGDPGAFAGLAQQYQPLALSLVDSILPNMPADSLGRDDLIQEANIALYRAAMAYDTAQTNVTFGLFAKVCIRNRLISALRKQRRSAKKRAVSKNPPVSPHPDDFDRDALNAQLNGLLTNYEEQVLGLRLSGYSYKEIAKRLKTDPKSVDNALFRIRKKIRIAQKSSE